MVINSLKALPSLGISFLINVVNRKCVSCVVIDVYSYESKRISDLSNSSYLLKTLMHKKILNYSVIPIENKNYMRVDIVNSANIFRQENLYVELDLLSSEVIKYAHALDKGLRMPNKKKTFGLQKSAELERMLAIWKGRFNTNHPIYIWSLNLLNEYKMDQRQPIVKEGENV